MLKSYCCLFLTSLLCQACGRRWEVMIRKLDSSGNQLLVGLLGLFLFHSLSRRLSLSPCVDNYWLLLSRLFTPFVCTAGTKFGVCVCARACVHTHMLQRRRLGCVGAALWSFHHLRFAVPQQSLCPSVWLRCVHAVDRSGVTIAPVTVHENG